ncbi:TPA: hypothetical protein ACH3X1_009240 [Trebouxia sp. C0004]
MAKVILLSPPSSDKPARPKRCHSNAQIFDDSEGEDEHESHLDKPVAKRLRQVPVEVQEAEELQEISEPDVILRRRRMHVQADATTAGREDDMIQQLQEAGEEMQEDDSDAVLERCFRHQVQLPLLVSHATLVAACGEAAQFFKPYQE